MTTKFHVDIEVELIPTYHQDPPQISYGIDGIILNRQDWDQAGILKFEYDLTTGPHVIFVNFENKRNDDTIVELGLDKYLTVGNISINGICLPKFNWVATYFPSYPEPWYSQQTPQPGPVITCPTHLGWNGRWQLQFDAPVFSWIHQIENMGWVWPT